MPRPREFDEAEVITAAIRHFWRHGYGGTSVRDLADTMKISAASLYNAFGDKRLLFERALMRYVGDTFAQKDDDPTGVAAIRGFFEKVIAFSVKDAHRRGCLLVNSALEVAPHDREISKIISGVLQQVESFFLRCIEQGQASGEIPATQSAPDAAKHLLALLLGMRVLARVRPERQLYDGLLRSVLRSLGQANELRR